jgi:REP element-mobilizing transposase RayT
MARPLRIEDLGALYHLTTRGNARRSIFKDDADRGVLEAYRRYGYTMKQIAAEAGVTMRRSAEKFVGLTEV